MTFDFAALFAFCDLHASRVYQPGMVRCLAGELNLLAGGRPRCFDRQGFPIPSDGVHSPTIVWALMQENHPETVVVAQDELPDGSQLSTVWLGLDHAWVGPPLIFETMRFGDVETHLFPGIGGRIGPHEYDSRKMLSFPDPEREGEETEQIRHATEEEACAIHHEVLRLCRLRFGH